MGKLRLASSILFWLREKVEETFRRGLAGSEWYDDLAQSGLVS